MSENNQNGFNNQYQNNMNNQNDFNSNQYQSTPNNQNDFYSNGNNAAGQNDFNNQYQNNMNGQNDFNNQYQNNMNGQNDFNNQYQNNMNGQNGFNNQYQNDFTKQFQNSAADYTSNFDPMDIESNKVLSAISYFGILFFIPLVAAPNSRFGKFHANQSLVLLIASVIVNVLSGAFSFFYNILPYGLYKILKIIPTLLGLVVFIAFIYGFINAISGKAKEIPVIGSVKIIKY